MTGWDVYWFTRLDAIFVFFVFMAIMLGITLMTVGIVTSIDGEWKKVKKWFFRGVVAFTVCLLVLMFVPTTKQAAAIYLLPKIVNNNQVQHIPENFAKLLNAKMEQWIRDTFEEKKDKKES